MKWNVTWIKNVISTWMCHWMSSSRMIRLIFSKIVNLLLSLNFMHKFLIIPFNRMVLPLRITYPICSMLSNKMMNFIKNCMCSCIFQRFAIAMYTPTRFNLMLHIYDALYSTFAAIIMIDWRSFLSRLWYFCRIMKKMCLKSRNLVHITVFWKDFSRFFDSFATLFEEKAILLFICST